jgi:hypothetical protein
MNPKDQISINIPHSVLVELIHVPFEIYRLVDLKELHFVQSLRVLPPDALGLFE